MMDFQQASNQSWLDELTHPATVLEDSVHLFSQFVSAVSLDASENILSHVEFSKCVRDLCVKAPSVARYLAREILDHSINDPHLEVQQIEEPEISTTTKRPSKRRKQADCSYQPPNPRTKPEISLKVAENSCKASGISPRVDGFVTCQPGHDDMTITQGSEIITEKVSRKEAVPDREAVVEEVVSQREVHDEALDNGITLSPMSSESVQLRAANSRSGVNNNATHEEPSVPLEKSTDDFQNGPHSHLHSEAEQQDTALSEIDGQVSEAQALSANSLSHKIKPHDTTFSGPVPSTPVRQNGGLLSPPSSNQSVTPQTAFCTPSIGRAAFAPLDNNQTSSPLDKVEMTSPIGILSAPSSTIQQQMSPCDTALTPAKQVDGDSPQSQDSPLILRPSQHVYTPPLADMVTKTIHIIYKMSRRQELATGVHLRILSTIRPAYDGASIIDVVGRPGSMRITDSPKTWSASMWISMLEAGHARSRRITIFNMIEWMGASEWYDAELEQAEKAQPRTKRGTPRKRLSTIVLDECLRKTQHTTAINNPEKLTLTDSQDRPSSLDVAGVQKRILDMRRKELTNKFHRGRTLRRLVQMTHLGILFDPNIWSYAKGSEENVDKIAALFQADSQKMELLSILDEQVELLARDGRPDLSRLLNALQSHSIIPSNEITSLQAEYGVEREPVPQGCLDTAIEHVVEGLSRIFGKHSLGEDDSVMVNGAVEFSCGVFDRLRSKEWLNCWDLAATLEMTDRPVFVQLGPSIPLHEKDANGEVTPISDPFRRWRKKIDDYKCKGRDDLEQPQVYVCPLNINTNHFTLLEINEQTRMIYHYDSMASQKIIHRKTKSSLVRRVVEAEFKDLDFGYIEANTPQQKDGWSCGLMTVRNAKRRMMGLPVGSWDDEVDPDRVAMWVIGDFQTFLENGALQPSRSSKKRKMADGPQSSVSEPSRSSKRLKQANGGS